MATDPKDGGPTTESREEKRVEVPTPTPTEVTVTETVEKTVKEG